MTKLEQHKLEALQRKYPNITTSEAALLVLFKPSRQK